MWSYTAHREIRTLRNDLVASQVALEGKRKEAAKKNEYSKKIEDIFTEYDEKTVAFVNYIYDNAFFQDGPKAQLVYKEWSDSIDSLARKHNKLKK